MRQYSSADIYIMADGSGLGLSIAKSLATIQNGNFDFELDGDLLKAIITFN